MSRTNQLKIIFPFFAADLEKFNSNIAEVEQMIAKYKNLLDTMDHSDLIASKFVGDHHRNMKNFIRNAKKDEMMDEDVFENLKRRSDVISHLIHT